MAGEARSDYAGLFVCVLAVLATVAFGGEITRGVIMVVVGAVVSRRWSSKSPEPAPLTKEGEALLRAVDGGHLNVVQSLADRHFIAAGEVDVPRTSAGRTALMSASFSGHLEVVEDLLLRGASVALVDCGPGFAALHYAAMDGHVSCVRILLDAQAAVDKRSKSGLTPLLASAGEGHVDTALLLLDARADVAARLGRDGPTVLASVLFAPNDDARRALVPRLINAGASPDDVVKGQTIWSIAASIGVDLDSDDE